MDTVVRGGGDAVPSGDTEESRIKVNSTTGFLTWNDNGTAYGVAGTDTATAATVATGVEVNRNNDVSTRLVAAGATLTLTQATHEGKIIALDTAAGSVVTLPAATGTGGRYYFLVTVTATTNSHVIKVAASTTNEMRGFVVQDADEATAPNIWWAADNDDTITLNRTTTGLAAQGEWFELIDATTGHWFVKGYSQASGTEATPFSATV